MGTSAPNHVPQTSAGWARVAALVGLAIALAWTAIRCVFLWPEFVREDGLFFRDPDDYMRLVRVRMIQRGESGFRIHRLARDGFPEGAPTHWTMPQDFVLLGLARLLAPVGGSADRARELAGLFAGPALETVLLGWLAWWASGALGGWGAAAALVLFAFSGAAAEPFMLAHPDHHGLILAASIVGLTAAAAAGRTAASDPILTRRAFAWACVSAAALAIGVWASIEVAVAWALIALSWALAVLAEPDAKASSSLARVATAWSACGFAATLAFLLIENGPGERLAPVFHRISMPCVSLWLVSAAWFALAAGLRNRPFLQTRGRRWALGAACGLALAAAWVAIWILAAAPLPDPSQRQALRRWFAMIDEFQPLLSGDPDHPFCELHGWLGFGVWALLPAILWVQRKKTWAVFPRLLWPLAALVYGALAFWQMRWTGYAAFAMAVVVGDAFGRLAEDWVRTTEAKQGRSRAREIGAGLAVLALALFLSLPEIFDPTGAACARGRQRKAIVDDARRVRELTRWINQRGEKDPSRSILAPWWMGSQILYDTDLPVVATPYANLPGLCDSARFFLAAEDRQALEILRRRRVAYVLSPSHAQFLIDGRYLLGLSGRRSAPSDPLAGFAPDSLRRTLQARLQGAPPQAPPALTLVASGAPAVGNQFPPYRLYHAAATE